MDARIGPVRFPVVQVGLRLFQTFKTKSFQRSILGMADAPFHLPLGEKRALQTVTRVDYKFSLSRIRSIH